MRDLESGISLAVFRSEGNGIPGTVKGGGRWGI